MGITAAGLLAQLLLHLKAGRNAQGRATVEMKVRLKEARSEGIKGGTLKMVADGFNAPVTAGNFIDLVDKKFYDNMEVQRADGFIVQTGNPGNEVSRSERIFELLRAAGAGGLPVCLVPA